MFIGKRETSFCHKKLLNFLTKINQTEFLIKQTRDGILKKKTPD